MKEFASVLAGAMVGKAATRLAIELDVRTGRARAPAPQTITFWWSLAAPIMVGLLEYFKALKPPLEHFMIGLGSQVATNLFDYAEEYLAPSPWALTAEEKMARQAVKEVAQPAPPTPSPFREITAFQRMETCKPCSDKLSHLPL